MLNRKATHGGIGYTALCGEHDAWGSAFYGQSNGAVKHAVASSCRALTAAAAGGAWCQLAILLKHVDSFVYIYDWFQNPQVRLKRFLEMHGAYGGPWRMICALPQ
jgi:gamma-glutamylcysteine synthetase